MSYNGSGTFVINSTGQPVVTGTVISSTAFNALTADLATGLSTAITKDGQTATTARILFAQGISSTLVTDATSATTGSIITAGGISTQKALWVGTTTTLAGTLTGAAATFSSTLGVTGDATFSGNGIKFNGSGSAQATPGIYYQSGTTLFSVPGTGGFAWVNATNTTALAYLTNAGLLGIGMTPSNILDITQNQNAGSAVKILNNSAGAVAWAGYQTSNGTTNSYMVQWGSSAAGAGYNVPDCMSIQTTCTNGMRLATTVSAPIIFYTNGTERARFGTDGSFLVGGTTNVGAGAAYFSSQIMIRRTTALQNAGVSTDYDGNSAQGISINDTASVNGSGFMYFATGGTGRGGITNNNNAGVLYNVTSDERLKTWRKDQRDFRSIIAGIEVGDVEWNAVPGSRMLAIMAQQTNKFYPDAITAGKADADVWQADYGRLAPLALWGIKDLYAENEALKATVATLEARLTALETK